MKILVGSFQCESNTFSPHKASKEDFHILREEAAIDAMHGCKILKKEGFERQKTYNIRIECKMKQKISV